MIIYTVDSIGHAGEKFSSIPVHFSVQSKNLQMPLGERTAKWPPL